MVHNSPAYCTMCGLGLLNESPSLVDPPLNNSPCAPSSKGLHLWSRHIKGKVSLADSRYEHTLPLSSLVHRVCLVP